MVEEAICRDHRSIAGCEEELSVLVHGKFVPLEVVRHERIQNEKE